MDNQAAPIPLATLSIRDSPEIQSVVAKDNVLLRGKQLDIKDSKEHLSTLFISLDVNIAALCASATSLVEKKCIAAYRSKIQGGQHFVGRQSPVPIVAADPPTAHPAGGEKTRGNEKPLWMRRRSQMILSEAATLEFLCKRVKSIPVPRVYGYDLDEHCRIGAAYLLLSIMPGRSLDDVWPNLSQRQKMENTIPELARILSDLSNNPVGECGSIYHGADGTFTFGPFGTAQDYLTALVEGQDLEEPPAEVDHAGHHAAVTMIAQRTRDVKWEENHVLVYPDWEHVNILIDEEGHVIGVIDWTGATALPTLTATPKLPHGLLDTDGMFERALEEAFYNQQPEPCACKAEAERLRLYWTIAILGRPLKREEAEYMRRHSGGKVAIEEFCLDSEVHTI
ncbi:hypothetical protein DACRYDRAFT_109106 [Dacryopinax primogenitus]|uniref:Aminoglycoside phosphotransferase domain-containing protein n=1 Tax=Dacryopinax primogenitus (strain DJM 731) TaxID=1858805 RepID=M5FX89_DACPD|nr:uncharacterized protein DACRYDRAFT_109106 [Dacryopinax primogenitus]EJU00375.1 hypothetical protein DACRYDRAFT_109106 [Dacryopinax primogenitus]